MFGKLVRHEFKHLGKWYLGLYVGVLTLAVLLSFWIKHIALRSVEQIDYFSSSSSTENTLLAISFFAFGLLIAVLVLSTLVLIINRFRHSVYGRQGYLTMTLPVSSHLIILSKFTAALILSILSTLTALIAVFILLYAIVTIEETHFLQAIHTLLTYTDWTHYLQLLLGALLDTCQGILLLYFSISVGQLFQNHRLLFAFLTYFGIGFVLFFINASLFYETTGFSSTIPGSPLISLEHIILAVAYYFGTHYILSKKLNLQ